MLRQQGAAGCPGSRPAWSRSASRRCATRLQRGANRLTYGQWSQPAEVLAATARRLGDATDVPSLLQTLVDELGQALDLHTWRSPTRPARPSPARGRPAARRPAAHDLVRRRGRRARAGRARPLRDATGSCSRTWPASSAPSCTPRRCSTPSAPPRSGWCSPARRNAAGCGATCTTGSAPRWPGCAAGRHAAQPARGPARSRRRRRGCSHLRSGIQGDGRRRTPDRRGAAAAGARRARPGRGACASWPAGSRRGGLTSRCAPDALPPAAGRRRGGGLPDRAGGADQRRPARRARQWPSCARRARRGLVAGRGPRRRHGRRLRRRTGGVGLASMRERAAEIGGSFASAGRPGPGSAPARVPSCHERRWTPR